MARNNWRQLGAPGGNPWALIGASRGPVKRSIPAPVPPWLTNAPSTSTMGLPPGTDPASVDPLSWAIAQAAQKMGMVNPTPVNNAGWGQPQTPQRVAPDYDPFGGVSPAAAHAATGIGAPIRQVHPYGGPLGPIGGVSAAPRAQQNPGVPGTMDALRARIAAQGGLQPGPRTPGRGFDPYPVQTGNRFDAMEALKVSGDWRNRISHMAASLNPSDTLHRIGRGIDFQHQSAGPAETAFTRMEHVADAHDAAARLARLMAGRKRGHSRIFAQ